MVIANKTKLGPDKALELAAIASTIHVARGKNVVTFHMKNDPPSSEELLKVMLGPTGNLRAPTIRKGKTVIVGYQNELYEKIFD
jgi:arsenate reductase-like glutaredoxin family protein